MIAVFGGGFGLYGHAAALAGLGHRVALPARYAASVASRPELAELGAQFDYIEDEDRLGHGADLAVLARRPADNRLLAERLLEQDPPRALVIEKPIAPTPPEAMALHARLAQALGGYGVPYLLGFCDWAKAAMDAGGREPVLIHWVMRRGNASDSWKYRAADGGGSLAFYCIHVIALMVDALGVPRMGRASDGAASAQGADSLKFTADNGRAAPWRCEFTLGDAPPAFSMRLGARTLFEAASPFGAFPARGAPDPRLGPLRQFYQEAIFAPGKPGPADAERLDRVHQAWAALQDETAT